MIQIHTSSNKGFIVWSTSKIYWLRSGWQHICGKNTQIQEDAKGKKNRIQG